MTIAANGRIAVDAMKAGSFDLVLMDMQMPELDGYALRASYDSPASPRRSTR